MLESMHWVLLISCLIVLFYLIKLCHFSWSIPQSHFHFSEAYFPLKILIFVLSLIAHSTPSECVSDFLPSDSLQTSFSFQTFQLLSLQALGCTHGMIIWTMRYSPSLDYLLLSVVFFAWTLHQARPGSFLLFSQRLWLFREFYYCW